MLTMPVLAGKGNNGKELWPIDVQSLLSARKNMVNLTFVDDMLNNTLISQLKLINMNM